MHFKTRFFAAAAVVLLAATVIFGSRFTIREPKPAEESKKDSWLERDDTIYFWYSDETLTNYVSSAAVTFGEREKVHVIPVLADDNEYLEAINKASLLKDQLPDVFLLGHDSLEKAYLAGLAGTILDPETICNEGSFPPAALSAITYKGKKIGYPLYFDTSVLVYNETYLAEWAKQRALYELQGGLNVDDEGELIGELSEELPDEATWAAKTAEYMMEAVPGTIDDILNIANTFDVPEGMESILKWDLSDVLYNYWIVGNYMNVGGPNGDDKKIVSINNEETRQCLESYTALNQFFFIEPETVTYETVIEEFLDKKVLFTIATTDMVKRLEDVKREGTLDFDYGAALMPAVNEQLKSKSVSVTQVVAVNTYSEHRELAEKFAAYLVGEYADSLYEKSGKLAANTSCDLDNGMATIFKAEYADSYPLPKMMETGHYWLLLERLFAKAWTGSDITEMLKELESQFHIN
ncbi:MAG: extracellular solute-binding protein [Acetatifactor sp.]|nr:extracellular solute-binding protein [Acetatifactor sp.]